MPTPTVQRRSWPPTVCLAASLLACGPAGADEAASKGALTPLAAARRPADGDPAALRAWLARHGITYGLIYTGEVLGNVSGGARRGGLYEGKLEGVLGVDLDKLAGLPGLSLSANAFQIHRTSGPRDRHFHGLNTISNIEAAPTTRLSELWLEQKLFDDRFSVRAGQLAADAEFFVSDVSQIFITSDWPTITGANLPSGGPAYPLATPGVRFKYDPAPRWSLLAAVFNGDPGDDGTVNRYGTNFRVGDPPLLMGEVQYRYNHEADARGLAGTLRLGGWRHFGQFDDLRFDDAGVPLASPRSSGRPRLFRGVSGVYGIIDQQIYRPAGGDANSGISVFGRIAATQPDRNLVDFYLDGGIVFSGLLPGRPDDRFGASLLYAHMSDRARAQDRDLVALTGIARPLRDYELTIELTYQAQIRSGWTVQPVVQYVVHPGGHIPDPASPNTPIKNGAVIGLRSTVTY